MYIPHRLGPGSLLSDEERKRRKKERNAAYRAENRGRLAADKRAIYREGKVEALANGPDLRVYNVGLAHSLALRVERNDRYRARILKKQRNRSYYLAQRIQYGQKNGPDLPPDLQVNGAGGCGK